MENDERAFQATAADITLEKKKKRKLPGGEEARGRQAKRGNKQARKTPAHQQQMAKKLIQDPKGKTEP